MTQEEKARAYDIALDKIKRLLGTGSNCSREELEYVFPELKESEDERIRKWLIYYFKEVCDNVSEKEKQGVLNWLEKHGMPAKYHDICDTCVRQPTCQSDCFLQQSEQKPTDKVEPKFKVGDKIKLAKEPKYPAREIIAIKNDAYYFDELVHLPLRWQDNWELVGQKPAVFSDQNPWTEEDEKMLKRVIDFIPQCMTAHGYNEYINWLKSLKDRVTTSVTVEA